MRKRCLCGLECVRCFVSDEGEGWRVAGGGRGGAGWKYFWTVGPWGRWFVLWDLDIGRFGDVIEARDRGLRVVLVDSGRH